MNINIFLLCYNEESLLPHIIKHYQKYLPSANIIIYDNESTDNSVNIANLNGCEIISWNSNNQIDDLKYVDIKNNCWKNIKDGWIIVSDMDEFLCVSELDLENEEKKNTSILTVRGIDIIGDSKNIKLNDINLADFRRYQDNNFESKNLCFYRNKITEMNYNCGAHTCEPKGEIKYSEKTYINKHMNYLGLNFYVDRIMNRYYRSHNMREKGLATHYIEDVLEIKNRYIKAVKNCKIIDF